MPNKFSISVDFVADAAYVKMSGARVASTRQMTDEVLVDLDEFGMVVGIEFLRIAAEIPFQRLTDDFHVHSADVELLRQLRPSIAGYLASSAEGTSEPSTSFHQIAAP